MVKIIQEEDLQRLKQFLILSHINKRLKDITALDVITATGISNESPKVATVSM